MSFQFDTLHITHQLTTGIGYPNYLGFDNDVIRGSVYLDGPTIIGDETSSNKVEGSLVVGPCNNEDSPIPLLCDPNLKFNSPWSATGCIVISGSTSLPGAEKYGENLAHPYSLVVKAGTHKVRDAKCVDTGYKSYPLVEVPSEGAAFFQGDVDIYGYARIKDRLSVVEKADFASNVAIRKTLVVGDDVAIGGDCCVTGDLDGTPVGRLLDRIIVADARPKPFDMVHPSLGEGHRLRYACIEGPEVGVYFRGRLKNKTEIELPWYWKDLVHFESITVQLQSIGAHQDIIVKRWDSEKIYLQSKGGMPIDCFYHVYAERKDVNALVVEYEGDKHSDYPDGDYNDPQFANVINTKTL